MKQGQVKLGQVKPGSGLARTHKARMGLDSTNLDRSSWDSIKSS